jgi:hypothetical protein
VPLALLLIRDVYFTPNFAALHSGLLPVLPLAKDLAGHYEDLMPNLRLLNYFKFIVRFPEDRQRKLKR